MDFFSASFWCAESEKKSIAINALYLFSEIINVFISVCNVLISFGYLVTMKYVHNELYWDVFDRLSDQTSSC